MSRFGKILVVVSLAVLAAPFAGYFYYDLVRFQPHRAEILRLVESAEAEDRALPVTTAQMLIFSLHGDTTHYITRLLLGRLNLSQGQWLMHSGIWESLVRLHLTEHDRLTIVASTVSTSGNRRGLSATARALYGKPLSQLSLDETARLIVLANYSTSWNNPARLAEASNQFLARYQESQKVQRD